MALKFAFFCLYLIFICDIYALDFEYHKYESMTDVLKNLSSKYTNIFPRLYSIGKSVEGRNLWVVEVTTANRTEVGIPNVKLIGNIHGNEAAGREVLLHFFEYLGENYNVDPTITSLLDTTKIHILPSLNPDGFEMSNSGICQGDHVRSNAKKVDLNRNFEDLYIKSKRVAQPETRAIEDWTKETQFILSASLHGGALVANYPYETVKELKWEKLLRELTENGDPEEQQKLRDNYIASLPVNPPHLSPDDDVFVHLAKTYANTHPTMHLGEPCQASPYKFPGGITNGAAWYPLKGGMQDYNYINRGCMEVTLEISCCKYPKAKELQKLWNENKNALVEFIKQAHQGVRGFIFDKHTRKSINGTTLRILGRDMNFTTSKNGEFWRILLPGQYKLQVNADGYHPETVAFSVNHTNAQLLQPQLTTIYVALTNITIPYTTTTQLTATSSQVPYVFSTTKKQYITQDYSEFYNDKNREMAYNQKKSTQGNAAKLDYVNNRSGKESFQNYTASSLTLALLLIALNFY